MKNTSKILITILIVVALAGNASAALTMTAAASHTSPASSAFAPDIGDTIKIHANLKNDGINTISNIAVKVKVQSTDEIICSKTVSSLAGGAEETVLCEWKITEKIDCGEQSIAVTANGGGYNPSGVLTPNVKGKVYHIVTEPDNPELGKAFKITIKDENENIVNGAKISLLGTSDGHEFETDQEDVYTENGYATMTVNKSGKYKIVSVYERELYCKKSSKIREVYSQLVAHGLKDSYGLDDDFQVRVTDTENNTVEAFIDVTGVDSKTDDCSHHGQTVNGEYTFNFRQKSLKKGTYEIKVYEKKDPWAPAKYHSVLIKVTLKEGSTYGTPSSSTPTSPITPQTKSTTPELSIEITPAINIIINEKIKIYVSSGGKSISGADITIRTLEGSDKTLKTSSNGETEFTIIELGYHDISAKKDGYSEAKTHFDSIRKEDIVENRDASGNSGVTDNAAAIGENNPVNNENENPASEDPGEINEESNHNEMTPINESVIKPADTNTNTFNSMNYNNIAYTGGIIMAVVILAIIIILLLIIWKFFKGKKAGETKKKRNIPSKSAAQTPIKPEENIPKIHHEPISVKVNDARIPQRRIEAKIQTPKTTQTPQQTSSLQQEPSGAGKAKDNYLDNITPKTVLTGIFILGGIAIMLLIIILLIVVIWKLL